ncbi:hypothetical protein QUF55_06905 [Clostridiaceae bacterium HSG29]|nr:hypothetical protein [Clostridiaceae bacterium HSG29]
MKEEIWPIITDYGEYTLDYFIDDEVISNLPVVGTGFKLIKVGKSISDRIFIEKMKKFIDNIDSNDSWHDKFSDEDECEKVSKKLVYIVHSSDNDEKMRIMAYIFNDYVKGKVDKEDFYLLLDIVMKSFFTYLKEFRNFAGKMITNNGKNYEKSYLEHMHNLGLFNYVGSTMTTIDKMGFYEPGATIIEINPSGTYLRDVLKDIYGRDKFNGQFNT